MLKSDDQNLELVGPIDSVDQLNADFYRRFPYPWPPMKFDYLLDPYFETALLNQSIGDWDNKVIPKNPKIWVAGCGTNLAVFTALKFPKATVLGSDISTKSLEICAGTASQLGISNLEFKEESINHVAYRETFDYIICTGVIHHNADPKATLEKLVRALKPAGILELMVYNRYHFIAQTAFQKAIRILGRNGNTSSINLESELSIARNLIDKFPGESQLSNFLTKFKDAPESMLADVLLQPVLYSYTVESLESLAADCNLELVAPYINLFDKTDGKTSWNIEFDDWKLQEYYETLPDSRRWQVTNLLLLEKSPLLWFYFQRKDCGRQKKSESQLCDEFLSERFVKTSTLQRSYILRGDEKYRLSPNSVPFPIAAPDVSVRKILDSVDAKSSMREIFQRLGIKTTFPVVNQARIKLTTPAFPYLRSIRSLNDEDRASTQFSAGSDKPDGLFNKFESKHDVNEKSRLEEPDLKGFRAVKPKPISLPQEKCEKQNDPVN